VKTRQPNPSTLFQKSADRVMNECLVNVPMQYHIGNW